MSSFEPLTSTKHRYVSSWRQYLFDTVLACAGVLLITGIIFTFQLYPRIPNVSIAFLLVILPLASVRGRYASILASLVAFFSFDFFIVPPLFTFVIYRVEEWIALFVFLVTAILTSQLAVMLRRIAEEAIQRERETAILYELVRMTNSEDRLELQLHLLARTIVDVFTVWGISDCAILQVDAAGIPRIQASASEVLVEPVLSRDEQAAAIWVVKHKRSVELSTNAPRSHIKRTSTALSSLQRLLHPNMRVSAPEQPRIYLLPLQTGQQVIGILRLCVQPDAQQQFPFQDLVNDEQQVNGKKSFFGIFLDQVASLIERAYLRRDNLRIELLQRTDALRAALLTSVSHDLRTPLTTIKAAASSLLQEDVQWDKDALFSFAHSIEGEADRLNHLVGNLLDMSRIEGGVLKPEKEWYPVTVLIHDVLRHLQPVLQQRQVEISLPNDLTAVELDYVQIDQVLTNVLENAIRYSAPDTPIEISAQFIASEVIIRVADRGPGIPAEALERVFDKFYRVLEKHPQAGYPTGSGLGLAICKGVVEAHGGRIWAERRMGGGSLFSIVLPIGKLEGIAV